MEGCMHFTPLAVSLLYFILINFGQVAGEWMRNLSAYEIAYFSYVDPSGNENAQMNHFTLGQNGNIYVGSVNYVFRLDSSLQQLQNESTCISPDHRCDRDTNYNKILVVDDRDRLITCGSEGGGICQLRDTDDITNVLLQPVTVSGTQRKGTSVAGFEKLSTVSLVAPRFRADVLYVAVTFPDQDGYRRIPPISRRLLDTADETHILTIENEDGIYINTDAREDVFQVHYVAVFSQDIFTYFVSSQKEDLDATVFVSKISRVCQNYKNLDTYTEITINCTGTDGSLYRLVQAAHIGVAGPDLASSLALEVGELLLYAVFAKNQEVPDATLGVPVEQSALCVYRFDDILQAFKDAVSGCIQDGDAHKIEYLRESECLGLPVQGGVRDGDLCAPFGEGIQLFKHAKGITPVQTIALLEQPGTPMSSITTSTEVNHTVAFIGTSRGDLLKVMHYVLPTDICTDCH